MKRSASSFWTGTLKAGSGKLTTASGTLSQTPYSFRTRFENQVGTNPEELIAAAHAGCFAMALAGELERGGFPPNEIHADGTATLEKVNEQWTITGIHLSVSADVPKISDSEFQKVAIAAKEGCPVSRALRMEITFEASLGLPKQKAAS